MQRYFGNQVSESKFVIAGDDQHHITRVMRMKKGDQLFCINAEGQSAFCEIEEITDEQVIANVVKWEEGSRELPVHVSIASGLPKGDKLEWIIQKGTELGAHEFIPFIAARSVVKWDDKKASKKVERYERIAKEAAEQSYRNLIPAVRSPLRFKDLLQQQDAFNYKLIAYEEEGKHGEASVLSKTLHQMKPGESLLFVFGPEGGLTPEEIELLVANGFKTCGLGPRILRTETAPLYALSAVSYHFDLMG